jgi:uncharacterized membrane protein YkoI
MTKVKKLFSTPKKTMVTIACMIVLVALLGTGTVFAARAVAESSSIGTENAKNFAFADAGVDPVSASNVRAEFDYEHGQFVYEVEFVSGNSEYEYWVKASDGTVVKKQVEIITKDGSNVVATAEISLDKAKEIALADAGLIITDVTFTEEKLDVDDGTSVYDIDFFVDNVEYEYEINAVTGAIYSKSKETIVTLAPESTASAATAESQPSSQPNKDTAKDTQPNQSSQISQASRQSAQNSQSKTQSASENISADTAKSKALADAGVSVSAATFIKAKLDYDDGIPTYDVEFYTSSHEYDYEIDARTGAIKSRDVEAIKTASQQENNKDSYIGVEKAKSIALGHAGVSNVTYTKAKLDHDDGQVVYEIEFRKGGVEYDYTIRATDGSILEHDSEWDD